MMSSDSACVEQVERDFFQQNSLEISHSFERNHRAKFASKLVAENNSKLKIKQNTHKRYLLPPKSQLNLK